MKSSNDRYSAVAWLVLGYGIARLISDGELGFLSGLEALAFTAAGLALVRGFLPLLFLRVLLVGSIAGLVDTSSYLLEAEGPLVWIGNAPYLVVEFAGLLVGAAAFRETAPLVGRVAPGLLAAIDSGSLTRSFADDRRVGMQAPVRVVLVLAACFAVLHLAFAVGIASLGEVVGAFAGTRASSGLLGFALPPSLALLVEDLLFLVAAAVTLRGVSFGRPLLLGLASLHAVEWFLAVAGLQVLSVYSVLALFTWSWVVVRLRPGGLAVPDSEQDALEVPATLVD